MKNIILLYFLLIIASSSVSTMNAQLKVSENGNVRLGAEADMEYGRVLLQ